MYDPRLGITVVQARPDRPEGATFSYLHERVHSRTGIGPGLSHGTILEEGIAYRVEQTAREVFGFAPQQSRLEWMSPAGLPLRYRGMSAGYGLAAMTIDLLVQADPDLLEALLCQSSAAPEIEAMIEGIRPGLYGYLMGIPRPTHQDYARHTRLIAMTIDERMRTVMRIVGVGHDELDDIARNGVAATHFRREVAAYERSNGYYFRQPAV